MYLRNVLLAAVLALFATLGFSATYQLDTSSKVGFSIYKFMIGSAVPGEFKDFKGMFEFDGKKKTIANVDVVIEAKSIFTNEPKRDDHLRSADFFEVETFKNLIFKSFDGTTLVDNKGKLKGNLTIKGITKEVTLDVLYKGTTAGKPYFEATTTVNRKDFNIIWNKLMDKGGVVLDDTVNIKITVIGVK